MSQHMIRQCHGHHGFCNGDTSYPDAGVVAAFGSDVDFIAFGVDAFDLGEHGGGWFNGEAGRDCVAI